MILGLTTPTSGSIHFAGRDITALPWKQRRSLCTDIQVIFQDPYSSLDPRKRVEDIIREPLDIHKIGTRSQRRGRVHERWIWSRWRPATGRCSRMNSAEDCGSESESPPRSRPARS